MSDRIVLETDEAIVEVVPRLGAALAAFDLKKDGERIPILRRWTEESDNPRALSSSPMVPWFGRIAGGGFTFGGKFYPIEPNDPMDALPLHGDGWMSPWEVTETKPGRVVMRLRSRAIPPFDYEVTQTVSLNRAALELELSLRHHGATPLPYGLGQHPWFVRTPGTRLQAKATGMWLEQPPDVPARTEPHAIAEAWDFTASRPLPDEFADNGYAGWDGRACIDWTDRGVAVDIEADSSTRFFHLYSLGKDCPFFCFEPITHPAHALNKPGTPEANGLRVLAPGAATSMRVRFTGKLT